LIPESKRAVVERALKETLGATDYEDIRILTEGLSSALVCRIEVRGCPYLLRIITRTDAAADPTRQYECMRSAAKAGFAPRVLYSSIEDRISITDFVDARPFPRGVAFDLLPNTIRAVHALPRIAKSIDYLEAMDGFIHKFEAAALLPASETQELFRLYAQMRGIYGQDDSEIVLNHNDLKPENILYDGERVWLVDWEAAFMNDRNVDLAVVANFLVTNDAEERDLLHAYLGTPPSEFDLARFFLMRQAVGVFYTVVFSLFGAGGKPIALNAPVPDFRDYHDRIWAGEISLAGSEAKLDYARVHRVQALEQMRSSRFEEALRIVAEGQGSA